MPPKKTAIHHKKAEPAATVKTGRYIEGIGRRKTAIARVRIFAGVKHAKPEISINQKPFAEYFSLKKLQQTVLAPYATADVHLKTSVQVKGGGAHAQAEAVRLGIARALVASEAELRPKLKAFGFLKRDPRMVERKKYGSRKARRPQQWRKR